MKEETLNTETHEQNESSWLAEHPWIALVDRDTDLDEAVLYSLDEIRIG